MKKNLVFKLGLFCAALVLIATCFVSSAWAKYTTTVSASDSARVAKFDISQKFDGQNFSNVETAKVNIFDTQFAHIKKTDEYNANSEKLIAPGSEGSFEIVITNTNSEVSVDNVFKEVVVSDNGIPLEWSLKVEGVSILTNGTAAEFKAALEALKYVWTVNGETVSDYETIADNALNIEVEWSWPYHVDVDGDDYDTTLGAAGSALYIVSFNIVSTQVQPA